MKKIINQIICGFMAIVMIIGLTTGNANAQSASQTDSAVENIVEGEGDACDFQVDTDLLSDPNDPARFLQCHPRGGYISMPCAPGTIFDSKEQVCINRN